MNPLGRFFVCKLSATATVFSISPLWANEESGNDKQMNNNNVPINNVPICQCANGRMKKLGNVKNQNNGKECRYRK